MEELVSVIMPNYNSEKFLVETINSVLCQTYGNWELIIVDDCSTDESLNIIKNFASNDNRIKFIVNNENKGAAYSRNIALQNAKGKWIAFLDSDDLWLPEKLECQIKFMRENDYRFSYTKYGCIDEHSQKLNKVITGPKKITKRKMFRYCYVGCLTVMYDAEYMGLLQVDEKIGNGRNDYALWLKAVKKSNCYYLNEQLAQYRLRKNSLSHRSFKKLLKYQYELFRIGEKMGAFRSAYHVAVNLIFGFLKKVFYSKKEK